MKNSKTKNSPCTQALKDMGISPSMFRILNRTFLNPESRENPGLKYGIRAYE